MKMNLTAQLSDLTNSRDNNFNLMRLGAAAAVVLSHSFILSYSEPNSIPRGIGYLAVNCFFVMSGFLVCKSVTERRATREFFRARILRIYPALVLAVLLCVLVIGPLHTQGTLSEYFTDSQTYKFLLKNSVLIFGIDHHLPSVFTTRGAETMVNAPLWTLVFEVYLYLCLGVLGAFTLRKSNASPLLFNSLVVTISLLALALYVYNITTQKFDLKLFEHGVRFAAMFGIGATFYIARHFVRLSPWVLLAVLALLAVSTKLPFLHKAILYPLLTYLLLCAAYIPRGFLLKFNMLGDYSYGVYIFAYPIQQSIANWYPGISTIELFLSSFTATLLLAVLSWHLLESKALQLKRKL